MAPQDQCQEATKMYPWLLLGMGLPLCISYCVRIRPLSNLELEAKGANIDLLELKGNSGSEKYFLNKAKPVDSLEGGIPTPQLLQISSKVPSL